ncbi:unnamed protein product [Enterobius vermicularis]|uniref:Protein alan shepard n=1 Tax=Enterobius vermicularis TaxID=51028 RepID=A0A0N4UX63_ENTVE|nr:unnamed protein product [Enterobius vermicularis]
MKHFEKGSICICLDFEEKQFVIGVEGFVEQFKFIFPLVAANMSPGVLGQTASPQQQNLHSSAYSYTGQSHPRPQNIYGTYQQQQQQCNSSCNGFASNIAIPNSIIRSRGASNSVTRNNTDSPQADAPLSSTNVYIRGLDSSTTDDDLRKKCEKYGAILSTKAIMDKTTGQCKGYGFVDFERADAALSAVEGLNQEGKIQAQMAKVSAVVRFVQQEQDPTNLYFANLPPKFTENDLEKALNGYGEVISTRILKDQDGVSRGVGFARMDSKELCDRIIKEMNGKTILNGTTQPLLVKFADSGKKLRPRPAPVQTVYSNVPQMDISPYFTNQYEPLNSSYIRSAPVPYMIPAASQYVMNPHYQHVISGYPDPQMGGIASQLHNLSIHGTNAAVSQQPTDMNGSVSNGAVSAGQSSGGSAVQPMTMHPSYTYPIYSYPFHYGVQGGEPNLAAMTLMQSATPPTAYMPSNDMLIHPELPSNAPAIYTSQPPPTMQSQAPTGAAPSK